MTVEKNALVLLKLTFPMSVLPWLIEEFGLHLTLLGCFAVRGDTNFAILSSLCSWTIWHWWRSTPFDRFFWTLSTACINSAPICSPAPVKTERIIDFQIHIKQDKNVNVYFHIYALWFKAVSVLVWNCYDFLTWSFVFDLCLKFVCKTTLTW